MKILFIFVFLVNLIFINCSENRTKPSKIIKESKVLEIGLQGEITGKRSEISGLAWYKDYLILFPQYPDRFNNHVFAIPKQEIETFLSGEKKEAITPLKIPVKTNKLENKINGFEGFEAIAFKGDSLFVTIESETNDEIKAYVASGRIKPDLSEIVISPEPLPLVISRSGANNMSEETLVIIKNKIMTIHEANGINVNQSPQGVLFDLSLNPAGNLAFPNIEYRITDATEVDESGKFWVINYMYPGDKKHLNPATDPLKEHFGTGTTHQKTSVVERLIEFQYINGKIVFSGEQPVYLELDINSDSRNWEGIVRMNDSGFLLATDRFPKTILAFVPYHK